MHYALDTNILSALSRDRPDDPAAIWLSEQDWARLWVPSFVLAEMVDGLHRLPEGRRRSGLWAWFFDELRPRFGDRILPFGEDEATLYGRMMGEGTRRGRRPPVRDCAIAATSQSHGCTLVTRNTRDFEALGIDFINPWES